MNGFVPRCMSTPDTGRFPYFDQLVPNFLMIFRKRWTFLNVKLWRLRFICCRTRSRGHPLSDHINGTLERSTHIWHFRFRLCLSGPRTIHMPFYENIWCGLTHSLPHASFTLSFTFALTHGHSTGTSGPIGDIAFKNMLNTNPEKVHEATVRPRCHAVFLHIYSRFIKSVERRL